MADTIPNQPINQSNLLRRAWIMSDLNECNGAYKPKEILIDFNNDCNIYIIDPEGNKISPTKNLSLALKSAISKHMTGINQHENATEEKNGFMSSEDKQLMLKLDALEKYIIENPYVELDSFDNITKGFLSSVDYEVKGNTFHIKDMMFSYKGYIFRIPSVDISIGERKDDYYEEMIYLSINEDLEQIGRNKYIIKVKKDNFNNLSDDTVIVPIFILRRCVNKKFNSVNPFGYLDENVVLDNTEIVPEWYILMDHSRAVAECKKFITDDSKSNVEQVVNLHFGMPHLPITENTLVMIDTKNSKAIDFVSNTNIDKNSVFRISPTGLAISKSQNKGINLPIDLDNQFTIEFLAMANSDKNVFLNEPIITLNDNNYNKIFSIKVITKNLSSNQQDLYLNTNDEDILLLKNMSSDFAMYKILFYDKTIEVRFNEVVLNKIEMHLDLSKISFFELSTLNVPMCDVRLSNVALTDENILPNDIHYNKGYMLPPLIEGCRKLSNNISYIFNSVRISYKDIGLVKDKNGVAWHKGDMILLNKNENEIISGVYNKSHSNAVITGIKSSNSFYVDSVEKLSIYDTIKIVKFNKNLFKIFKILDIDKDDKSVKVIDVTTGTLTPIQDLNESYMYARLFDDEVAPSIEVTDINHNVINISQFPDDNGNVKLQLLEDARTDELYVSYILSTNYSDLIPRFSSIKEVYMDNVICEEMKINNIEVDRSKIQILDSTFTNITTERVTEYHTNGNAINITVKIPLDNVLVNDNLTVVEDTIISTLLDSVEVNMDIANNKDLKIYTFEESIDIPQSDVISNYSMKFISTDKTIEDNNFVLRFKLTGTGENALILDRIKVLVNLKECKNNEKVYHKKDSNKLDDMLIISTDVDNLYIKTVLNTDAVTNVLLTVYQEIPTTQYNKSDMLIETLEHDNKRYLIKVDNRDIVYVANEKEKVVEIPTKIKLKGGDI